MHLEWSRSEVEISIEAPEGEKIAIEAPASLELRWNGGSQSFTGLGSDLSGTLDIITPRGVEIAGNLTISLCTLDGAQCRQGRYALTGRLPRDKRGTNEILVVDQDVDIDVGGGGDTDGQWQGDALDTFKKALGQAAEAQKIVLLDFGAIWCPPCAMLSAEVFHGLDAEVTLDGFELAMLDVDDPSSWSVKDRYEIGSYPTVVAVTPGGDEIGRVVGYEGRDEFVEWLDTVRAGEAGLPSSPLDVSAEEAGVIAFELAKQGRAADARPWIVRGSESPNNIPFRVARFISEPTEEDLRWLAFERADPSEYYYYATALLKEHEEVKAELLEGVNRALIGASGERAASILGVAAALSGEDKTLYAAAAASLRTELRGEPALDKGYITWLASLMASGGDESGALSMLREAQVEWPNEPTFFMAEASLLLAQEMSAASLDAAQKALDLSWGDNRLRVVYQIAEALYALDRSEAAEEFVNKELAAQQPPSDTQKVRTHRYRQKLVDLVAAQQSRLADEEEATEE